MASGAMSSAVAMGTSKREWSCALGTKQEVLDLLEQRRLKVCGQYPGLDCLKDMGEGRSEEDRRPVGALAEQNARLLQEGRKIINQIKAAVRRVEGETYGVCTDCDEDISLPRLRCLPEAAQCIPCKQLQER